MPNPPTPTEVKRRRGNPGKRPLAKPGALVALPAATEPPTPARPLGPEGKRLWDRMWTNGAVWVSPNTDSELVLMTCEAMDERVSLRVQVLRDGEWRDRVALRALDTQLESMLSALGFSPVSRTRLGVAEVRAMSTLEKLAAQRGGN